MLADCASLTPYTGEAYRCGGTGHSESFLEPPALPVVFLYKKRSARLQCTLQPGGYIGSVILQGGAKPPTQAMAAILLAQQILHIDHAVAADLNRGIFFFVGFLSGIVPGKESIQICERGLVSKLLRAGHSLKLLVGQQGGRSFGGIAGLGFGCRAVGLSLSGRIVGFSLGRRAAGLSLSCRAAGLGFGHRTVRLGFGGCGFIRCAGRGLGRIRCGHIVEDRIFQTALQRNRRGSGGRCIGNGLAAGAQRQAKQQKRCND